MDYKHKKMNMEQNKPSIQLLICPKVRKSDKCILNLMLILKPENKKKDNTTGKWIILISDLVKFKKISYIMK